MEPGSEDVETTSIVLLNTRMLRSYTSIRDMMNKETDSPWGTNSKSKDNNVFNVDLQSTMASRSLEFLKATQKVIQKKRSAVAVHINARFIELYRKFKGREAASTYVYRAIKNTSMGITNMIGPTEKMSVADHPVKGLYFLIAGNPLNLGVAMVSYMGEMRASIGTEKGFIDPNKLKSHIQRAFDLILNSTPHACD